MSNAIYFHLDNQDFLPVGIEYDNISNIENYPDNSIEKILIQDLLDYYAIEDNNILLTTIKNKLKPGGFLSIQSIDIKQLCVAVSFGEISSDLAKELLYPHKKSIKSIYDIESIVKEAEFEIEIKKYINIFEYYLLAKKI